LSTSQRELGNSSASALDNFFIEVSRYEDFSVIPFVNDLSDHEAQILTINISLQRRTATIQQRVTAVLRSIPKEAFSDSFQKLYERCQPRVVKDGDYFEAQ
jgi:hypothetical protein